MDDNLIRSITIDGFRAFEHFELHDLGRVNLLVGKNNSGKSSVLEAIQIASSYADPTALFSVMSRRGERHWDEDDSLPRAWDISHLFHGHSAELGQCFQIHEKRNNSDAELDVKIVQATSENVGPGTSVSDEFLDDSNVFAIHLDWKVGGKVIDSGVLPLLAGRGLLTRAYRSARYMRNLQVPAITLVSTSALSPLQVVQYFDQIVLTSEEDLVLDALHTIEPTIERIAATSTRARGDSSERAGIKVKMKGVEEPIPIGSMGDGIWRMLGLSLALAKSSDGILLIDEIDTGLHYTVMEKMWKLVYEGAKRLNVQVFATTHSRDCVESLAEIASTDAHEGNDDVTIQRIERDRETSVVFKGNRVVVAAERGIEVR